MRAVASGMAPNFREAMRSLTADVLTYYLPFLTALPHDAVRDATDAGQDATNGVQDATDDVQDATYAVQDATDTVRNATDATVVYATGKGPDNGAHLRGTILGPPCCTAVVPLADGKSVSPGRTSKQLRRNGGAGMEGGCCPGAHVTRDTALRQSKVPGSCTCVPS